LVSPLQIRIRAALDKEPDGMTANQLVLAAQSCPESIRKALARMGDVYIDRWVKEGTQFCAVHCLAFVPEDCPHP
jgi:hypothetical protein